MRPRWWTVALVTMTVCSGAAFAKPRPIQSQPIQVKVVVVAMFEVGNDTGDGPGELQYWVERDHLERVYAMPDAYHAVRMNDRGEMAVLTGQGTAHAASTIMAVGLDPRFDFSHAYWIVAGIAGGTPDRISLGSAAWARWVVDGDLGYEIDAREIPQDWPTGMLPLRKKVPYETPAEPLDGQAYSLNANLAQWAFDLTRSTPLDDSDKLREIRSHFAGEAAKRPPFVALGDEISSSTYWHGRLLDAWAQHWVPYFTGGKGMFADHSDGRHGDAAVAGVSGARGAHRHQSGAGAASGEQLRSAAGGVERGGEPSEAAHRRIRCLPARARGGIPGGAHRSERTPEQLGAV
jgi:purine nucleoside permease